MCPRITAQHKEEAGGLRDNKKMEIGRVFFIANLPFLIKIMNVLKLSRKQLWHAILSYSLVLIMLTSQIPVMQ